MSEVIVVVNFEGRTYRPLPIYWPLRKEDIYLKGEYLRKINWPRPLGTEKAQDGSYYREYTIEWHVQTILFHGRRMTRRSNPEEKQGLRDLHIEGSKVTTVLYEYLTPNAPGSFWTDAAVVTKEVVRKAVEDNPIPCETCGVMSG